MQLTRFWSVAVALVATTILGVCAGVLSQQSVALAQADAAQTYTIQAGGQGPANIDVLSFFPQSLLVHRGDTVTWEIAGFHNVRFGSEPLQQVMMQEVNGQTLPVFNSEIVTPTIQSGATYSGGDANAGMPMPGQPPVFSLVIDLEPGTYPYLCDIHPGMAGTLTVVEDGAEIPSPAEAEVQKMTEFLSTVGAATAASIETEAATLQNAEIQVGSANTGRVTVNQYFPFFTTITAGESVTWTNPEGSIEPHTISWPPVRGQDFTPVEVEGGAPLLTFGPSIAPMTQSGATVGADEAFSSGFIEPGQSFSLTFSEPGVYPYTCNIHPGMNGVVVVEPA